MTEEEARDWARRRIDTLGMQSLEKFAGLVVEENQRQNLISPTTESSIWSRHMVDSLQLLTMTDRGGQWLDIGSGGGFPGLVLAIAGVGSMLLIEPRRRRAEFLQTCIDQLGLRNTTLAADKIENVSIQADVITARAVAPTEKLLRLAAHCAKPDCTWLLPRGASDLTSTALLTQQGTLFHVKQSVTNPASSILIVRGRVA